MIDEKSDHSAPKVEESGTSKKSLLENLTDKLGKFTQKSIEVVKTGTDKASHFATESAHLAKLHIDLRTAKDSMNKNYLESGKKLWVLYQEDKLPVKMREVFAEELADFTEMDAKIKALQEEIETVSLLEKPEDEGPKEA